MSFKKVCVIGLGYIGLPTAAVLARSGYDVFGVDVDNYIVDTVNQGEIHIVEPELKGCVGDAVAAGKLKAFSSPQAADIFIICVPTPFVESAGLPTPNIEIVLSAAESIGAVVKEGDLIILESTSPVGTTEKVQKTLEDVGVDVAKINIAYCPERVLPGNILVELIGNDRIVGGLTPAATLAAAKFCRSFVNGQVFETDAKTAEMCKLAENSYRDVNIAFANELSLLCHQENINVWNLISLANRHPRVDILQPGPGVGGHCIAVDPWFIISKDLKNSRLIKTGREVNNHKTDWVINEIKVAVEKYTLERGEKPKIICMGLTFKPNIGDIRESPAIRVVEQLKTEGFEVVAVEPNLKSHSSIGLVEVGVINTDEAVVAILVNHREFNDCLIKERLRLISALDFCGLLRN